MTDDEQSWIANVLPFPPFCGRDEGWIQPPDNAGGSLPNSDEPISHNPTDSSERQ